MSPKREDCPEPLPFRWMMGRPGRLLRRVLPLISCACIALAACDDQPSEPEEIAVVQLVEHEVTLGVGDWVQLDLLPMLPPGYVPPVVWTSADPETATVEPEGATAARVRGIRAGETVIRASGEGASDSATVVVLPSEPAPSATIIPGTSPGWSVTFPGDTVVIPADPCG